MDIEKESNREAFEKAFAQTEFYRNKADLYSLLADIDDETFDFFRKNGFGDYSVGEAQAAWSAWQAAKAQAVQEWISVKNAMPKAGSWFVAYDDFNGFIDTGKADGDEDPNNVFFSHWLPLPEAPVKQEQAND